MKKLIAITDLQFGSTGKGLIAGVLAKQWHPDVIVTAWAPNAGHTFVDAHGNKFVNIALPNGLVSNSVNTVMLGPGSLIDPIKLMEEIDVYRKYGIEEKLIIHPNAGVVLQRHKEAEAIYGFKIGSTMKGCGEAAINKIRRETGDMCNVAKYALKGTPLHKYVVSVDSYNNILDKAEIVMIEGAQGFSLSINQGFYPYTTSRDCTVHQMLSDCAIPFRRYSTLTADIIGTARTFPIRVANRFDASGNQVGTSGPCYPDQRELAWSELGKEPELTTVTKLPRRIFTWSDDQIHDAIRMNGANYVFLNFVNYLRDESGNQLSIDNFDISRPELLRMVKTINQAGAMVKWLGFGPSETDVRWV